MTPDYGKWFPLEGVFGPSTGFPVMDVDDSKFRATFDTAGDYSITIEFKEVDTGEVLATYVMEVTVNEKPHIPMEVTAEVEPFTVGVQQEFIVKTVANDDAGRMVRAYFDIPAGVAVEYQEQNPAHPDYGKWFPLEGVFGPSTGFPVMDVDDSKFRATFDTAGDYSITIEFKEVDTGEVLATYVMEVKVVEAHPLQEVIDGYSISASYESRTLTAVFDEYMEELPAGLEGYKIDVLITLGDALPEGTEIEVRYNDGFPLPLQDNWRNNFNEAHQIWLGEGILNIGGAKPFVGGEPGKWTITISGNEEDIDTTVKIESAISNDEFETWTVIADAEVDVKLDAAIDD